MTLLQTVAAAADGHGKELIAAGATFLLVAAQWIAAHHKGRNREKSLGDQLDRKLKPLHEGMSTLTLEVRDLRAHVIGPDGENGLRGDVRELKEEVSGLLTRERDNLARKVGTLDRRSP